MCIGKCTNNVDEPKRWKANFRCALNSLPDVQEVKDLAQMRGKDPFKVYEFLDADSTRNGRTRSMFHALLVTFFAGLSGRGPIRWIESDRIGQACRCSLD